MSEFDQAFSSTLEISRISPLRRPVDSMMSARLYSAPRTPLSLLVSIEEAHGRLSLAPLSMLEAANVNMLEC